MAVLAVSPTPLTSGDSDSDADASGLWLLAHALEHPVEKRVVADQAAEA